MQKSWEGQSFPRAGMAAPWHFLCSSPASPGKSLFIPPRLLRITQYWLITMNNIKTNIYLLIHVQYITRYICGQV